MSAKIINLDTVRKGLREAASDRPPDEFCPIWEELFGKETDQGYRECPGDESFGVCPKCTAANATALVMRNVDRNHYLCCDKHNVYWHIGSNLFSGWRHESAKQHRENEAKLAGMQRIAEHWLRA